MSFLRRLLGNRSGPDLGDAGPGGTDWDREPAPPPEIGSHTYLEFVGGSAAKFYAAIIEQGPSDTWSVSFNFGRIGFPREWARKVESAGEPEARRVYSELVAEKVRKGYDIRPWPVSLALPSGDLPDPQPEAAAVTTRGIYSSAVAGRLPPSVGASVDGVDLPPGRLLHPMPEGGPRGDHPVLWVSDAPLENVADMWKPLSRAFPQTGLWPLVLDPGHGIDRMPEVLMDVPRSAGADPFQLLRRWWHDSVGIDDDEFDEPAFAPFGRKFPGLSARTPGDRPPSIEQHVSGVEGHIALVAVERPARTLEAIGWMGPANYDMNPTEQSAILDTWEDRFDAYLIGLGFDTITLAVGRPPRDLRSATLVAAEHLAFCSDNIFEGVGSIGDYAPLLVGANRWDFWWD